MSNADSVGQAGAKPADMTSVIRRPVVPLINPPSESDLSLRLARIEASQAGIESQLLSIRIAIDALTEAVEAVNPK